MNLFKRGEKVKDPKTYKCYSIINAKTKSKMKLFKIIAAIDKQGLYKRIIVMDVEEAHKSYIGEGSRIGKDKLMKIDTKLFENSSSIRYFTYCLDGDQQKALDMLKAHIVSKVMQYKSEIDLLATFLEK